MSALIKVKTLIYSKHTMELRGQENITLVVPFIKSFGEIIPRYYAIHSAFFNDLGISENDFIEKNSLYADDFYNLECYCIEYKDITSEERKLLIFKYKKDAEKFISELKSCINEFYSNADAYIKFIN